MMFSIRPAIPADIPAIAFIHVDGWRSSYGDVVGRAFLESLNVEEKEKNWGVWFSGGQVDVLLAEDETGKPAGFISFGKLKTAPPGMSPIRPLYTAEVYAIYILRDFQGQGLGRRLMSAAAAQLKEKKHKSLCLWVVEGNKRAIEFYKALGGQRCGKKPTEIGGHAMTDVCFGWRDAGILIKAA